MAKPLASPVVAQGVERLVRAMHAAYPEIATEGVRPKEPGLFIGDIAGQRVCMEPGKRNSRLFLVEKRKRGATSYFRYVFDLLKKGVAPQGKPPGEEELELAMWLANAAVELEELAAANAAAEESAAAKAAVELEELVAAKVAAELEELAAD